MKPSPAWHAECRDLYAQGVDYRIIAKRMGKTTADIKWVLDIDGTREKQRDAARKSRASLVGFCHNPKAKVMAPKIGRRVVSNDEKMAAARAFAAGKIDRAELMRRITP